VQGDDQRRLLVFLDLGGDKQGELHFLVGLFELVAALLDAGVRGRIEAAPAACWRLGGCEWRSPEGKREADDTDGLGQSRLDSHHVKLLVPATSRRGLPRV
jgi:hypothetical protein